MVVAQHPERNRSQPDRPQVQWICKCECGNETVATSAILNAGKKKSCGCRISQVVDRVGDRYGRLLVLALAPREFWPTRNALWFAECDCGEFVLVMGQYLGDGATRSCGCLKSEVARETHRRRCAEGRAPNYRHGHATNGANSPTYVSWCGMLRRCEDPNIKGYENYGGRGITVHEDWLTFDNFLADMGERPEWADGGIDRIDVDGNYEPDNCRWATKSEQAQNKRPRK